MLSIPIDWLFIWFAITSWIYPFVFYCLIGLIIYSIHKLKSKIQQNSNLKDKVPIYISVMIPCRNEERVIENTLKQIKTLEYDHKKIEVIVIDDGSTDNTSQVVSNFIENNIGYNITFILYKIPNIISGLGKGKALDRCFKDYLIENSIFASKQNHIIGVVDADGHVQKNVLSQVANEFQNCKLGGVNSSILIRNKEDNFLTRMQDIEFRIGARYFNFLRGYSYKNAFMGGNGQFIRKEVLIQINDKHNYVWNAESLTEDLDVGLEMIKYGWEAKQLVNSYVSQQGLSDFKLLYKQRIRWSWGVWQTTLSQILSLKVFYDSQASIISRFDVFMLLMNNVWYVLLLPLTLILTFLYVGEVIKLEFYFESWILWVNATLWTVFILIGLLTVKDFRNWRIFVDFVVYILYTIIMMTTLFVGFYNVLINKEARWVKTQRKIENRGDNSNDTTEPNEEFKSSEEKEVIGMNTILFNV